MTSCASDDDTSTKETPGSQFEHAGKPHTYNSTISGGELDGKSFSGEIGNTLLFTELANYSAYMDAVQNGQKKYQSAYS